MTSNLSFVAARVRDFILGSGHLGPAAGSSLFETIALELFTVQLNQNAAYREFCRANAIEPESVCLWSDIPAAPASAFKELELSCLPSAERTAVFNSSGTTDQRPSRHFHSVDSLALYEASLLAGFKESVVGPALPHLRCLFLTPPPAEAPRSSLVHMFETVRRACATAESEFFGHTTHGVEWSLHLERLVIALYDCQAKSEPVALLGTAFNFVHLLDALTKRGHTFALPRGSRVMETGGYKGRSRSLPKEELHRLITAQLGIPPGHIICEYGMSELSSQAYCRSVSGAEGWTRNTEYFRFPPWARFLVISPETGRPVPEGEPGLLRVFDLANVASVIAVQTEDLAVARGDGFELLGRARLAEPRGCSLVSA